MVALFIVACVSFGCPRVLYLDYQPSNSLKGNGTVQVTPFLYAGHPTGLMKRKELESSSRNVEALYLSQDIGEFFTNAVRQELTFSGYHVQPGEARVVSGTVEHFFLDYVGEVEQRFEVLATFKVNRTDAAVFTSVCRSNRQQSGDWMNSGLIIKRGIKDCIEQFLNNARAAGAL
ncbi:MAG TPA: hypothetical protein VK901_21595 [Nitrospiraceae bacterium]|nr:hypothetical protein [Nitrospiraceae bacterium]